MTFTHFLPPAIFECVFGGRYKVIENTNPDVLAGIREIRTQIAFLIEKCGVGATDEILALPIPIGGGVCPRCNGAGGVLFMDDIHDEAQREDPCKLCNGTGSLPVVEKTLGQILGEVMKCGTA